MLERGHRLGLVLEAAAEGRIDEQLGAQHLDGHAPANRLDLADEDLAHGAVAEPLDELVAPGDDVARQERTAREHLQEVLRQVVDARAARHRGKTRGLVTRRRLANHGFPAEPVLRWRPLVAQEAAASYIVTRLTLRRGSIRFPRRLSFS